MKRVKKIFSGGMNSDDTPQLIGDNEYLQVQNGRIAINENGRDKRVENIYGTELLNSGVLPSGTNQNIGSTIDNARRRIIYFNWNSLGEHGIYVYDIPTSTNYKVLLNSNIYNTPLNFSRDYRIDRNAKVIGNLLYWTDNNNQPRKVNIEAGIKTNQPSYVTDVEPYSTPIDYKWLQWIKTPPIYPITTTKNTDTGYTSNFIQDGAFYFTYRYQFKDYEYSALGMYSALVPPNTYRFLGYTNNTSITNETYNYIEALIPFDEQISDEVLAVEICVKFGNNGKTQIIKTYNKNNPTDAAAIVLHNAGTTNLGIDFYNDIQGISLSEVESVNDQDIVPISVKTLELAKDRLFAGDVVVGYNSPNQTSLSLTSLSGVSANTTTLQKVFKTGSTRKMAVTFYDEFKRKCGVVESKDIINLPVQGAAIPVVRVGSANWSLSNSSATDEIPDWAYYYSVDISDDLNFQDFICYFNTSYGLDNNNKGIQYVEKFEGGQYYYVLYTQVGSSYIMPYNANYLGVAISTRDLVTANGGYVFNEGDWCEIMVYNSAISTASRYTAKVLGTDGYFIILGNIDMGDLGTFLNTAYDATPTASKILTFTIYTPKKQSENELYYTQGEIYEISNPTTISRQYSTLSGSFSGDVYTYQSTARGWASSYLPVIDLKSNNNDVKEWVKNLGFSNIVDTIGQKQLKTTIAYSDVFIQETRNNGLNKYQATSRKQLGNSNGEIQKLQLTNKKQEDGTVMLSICTNGVLSIYLGETQLVAANVNSSLATSDNVIGTVNALRNQFGTITPESVFEYLGNVYWFDTLNGVVAMYSSNGVQPISDYKMNRFFKKYAKEYNSSSKNNIRNINGFFHLPSGIDPSTREVLFVTPALIYENYATNLPTYTSVPSYATSIINRFDVYDKLGKTISFDFEENNWKSTYQYLPEWIEYVENKMFAFKNGSLYSHNTDSVNLNTFYGTQYPLRLMSSWNIKEMPSAIKDCYGIGIESNVAPDWSVVYSEYPNIQISDLVADDYTDNTEGVFYAHWYRDRISPNTSGTYDEKIYKGDEVKSAYPFVMLEFQQYNSLIYINFVNFNFEISKGQLQLNQ